MFSRIFVFWIYFSIVYMHGISSFCYQAIMVTIDFSIKLSNNESEEVEAKSTTDVNDQKSRVKFSANGDKQEHRIRLDHENLSSRALVPRNATPKRIVLIVEMDNNEHHVPRE